MFLDDELEEKYNSSKKESREDYANLSMELYRIMKDKFCNTKCNSNKELSALAKQINNYWNLFVKKHNEFKKDAFKEHLKKALPEEQFNLLFN